MTACTGDRLRHLLDHLQERRRPARPREHEDDRPPARQAATRRAGGARRPVGEHLDPRRDKTTYDEAKAVLLDYYARGSRNVAEAQHRLAHLDGFFAGTKLTDIKTALVERYTKRRTEGAAAAGTINREVSTLITLLHVAHGRELLQAMPATKGWKLPEPPPRAGFVTDEEFPAVQRHLPDELKVAALVAFTLGWRSERCSTFVGISSTPRPAPCASIPAPRRIGTGGWRTCQTSCVPPW